MNVITEFIQDYGLITILLLLGTIITQSQIIDKYKKSSKNTYSDESINNRRKPRKFKSLYIKELGYDVRTVEKKRFRESSPYTKKRYFLNDVEKDFYVKLKLALKDTDYYICPKVSLTSFIYVNEKYDYNYYFDKIKTKFIDFLICDKSSMEPLIVIELDDSEFKSQDSIELDKFFTMTLNDAKIPIFRFDIFNYSVDEIRYKINNLTQTASD